MTKRYSFIVADKYAMGLEYLLRRLGTNNKTLLFKLLIMYALDHEKDFIDYAQKRAIGI